MGLLKAAPRQIELDVFAHAPTHRRDHRRRRIEDDVRGAPHPLEQGLLFGGGLVDARGGGLARHLASHGSSRRRPEPYTGGSVTASTEPIITGDGVPSVPT